MNQKLKWVLPILLLVFITFQGCTRMMIDAGGLDKQVYMTRGDQTGLERLSDFSTTINGAWVFWGLCTVKTPDLQKLIHREITRQNGSAVISIHMQSKVTFVDGLINFLTLGIYSVRTLKVSGTVVKFAETSSLSPLDEADLVIWLSKCGTLNASCAGLVDSDTDFKVVFRDHHLREEVHNEAL